MPEQYWNLTRGETMAKAIGYSYNSAIRSHDFRMIYNMIYNTIPKAQKKSLRQLWPIDLLDEKTEKERSNKIEWLKRIGKWEN